MVDQRWMVLALLLVVAGSMAILAPKLLVAMNERVTKMLVSFDAPLLRFRYVVGVVFFVAGYLCFRLALLMPTLPTE